MKDSITFDFGSGSIPAHQHQNPDGSLGGWVADTTAFVAETAYIGPEAERHPFWQTC